MLKARLQKLTEKADEQYAIMLVPLESFLTSSQWSIPVDGVHGATLTQIVAILLQGDQEASVLQRYLCMPLVAPFARVLMFVQKKLKQKEYPGAPDFAADVELVFSNAMTFNQEHTQIWEDALTLRVSLIIVVIHGYVPNAPQESLQAVDVGLALASFSASILSTFCQNQD